MSSAKVLETARSFALDQIQHMSPAITALDLTDDLNTILSAIEDWVRQLTVEQKSELATIMAVSRSQRIIERRTVKGVEIIVGENASPSNLSTTRTAWLITKDVPPHSMDIQNLITDLGVDELVCVMFSKDGALLGPVNINEKIKVVPFSEILFNALPAAIAYKIYTEEFFFSITSFPGGREAIDMALTRHGLQQNQLANDFATLSREFGIPY
jgi:hypothetical protein